MDARIVRGARRACALLDSRGAMGGHVRFSPAKTNPFARAAGPGARACTVTVRRGSICQNKPIRRAPRGERLRHAPSHGAEGPSAKTNPFGARRGNVLTSFWQNKPIQRAGARAGARDGSAPAQIGKTNPSGARRGGPATRCDVARSEGSESTERSHFKPTENRIGEAETRFWSCGDDRAGAERTHWRAPRHSGSIPVASSQSPTTNHPHMMSRP